MPLGLEQGSTTGPPEGLSAKEEEAAVILAS